MRRLLGYIGIGLGIMMSGAASAQTATSTPESLIVPTPVMGVVDLAALAEIDLLAVPILPEISPTTRILYQQGQAAGRRAQVFARVGDCMTASVEYFLGPFAQVDMIEWGEYSALQAVVETFSLPARERGDFAPNSFANVGLAAENGFNTASVQDALWSNPEWCDLDETPLACEYRVSQPAFSLIMFGTNDVMFFDAAFFDFNLRQIVATTMQQDIVPVLYTFPHRPEFPEKVIQFNQIIVAIARDYEMPLVNLYRAVDALPDRGVDAAQPTHLSIPPDGNTANLAANGLQYGYNVRNLLTLQLLDLLQSELLAADGVE